VQRQHRVADAGVVDGDVDPPETLDRARKEALNILR